MLSDSISYHYQALQCQELRSDRNPLTNLLYKHTSGTEHMTMGINQIPTVQTKQHHVALNEQLTTADYLSMVTDLK